MDRQPLASLAGVQLGLLGRGELSFDAALNGRRHRELEGGAWIDYVPGWVEGHARLFEDLVRSTSWRTSEERMYDRIVQVPRLFAALPADGPGHPLIEPMRSALSLRYGEDFSRVSLADGSNNRPSGGDTRRWEQGIGVNLRRTRARWFG